MPQKMAGVKARPQKCQVQVQTTVLQHSIPQRVNDTLEMI